MDSLRAGLIALKDALDWLPDSLIGIVMLAIAAAGALALHRAYEHVLQRFLLQRLPFVSALLSRTRTVTQLAALVVAFIVVRPIAPFDPDTSSALARLILITIIGLVGWAALTAMHMAADLYLSRFKLDEGDDELARKHVTQVQVLARAADTLIIVFTVAAALMTFEPVRQYGISLFASAGVAGIVAGLAARPLLTNLFAGVQLAMTQPIRLDDMVTIEDETGKVEQIGSTYVVLRMWDWRRMVVPLSYFSEKPFVNWTREGSSVIGAVHLYLDYSAPIAAIRARAREITAASKAWNRGVLNVEVTDARERTMEVRITASANTPNDAWALRCELREKLIDFLQRDYPASLPRQRLDDDCEETVVPPAGATTRKIVRRKSRSSST